LEANENLKFLKENKYFSVKAKSYPNDVDKLYNVQQFTLNTLFTKKREIEAGKLFVVNIWVTRKLLIESEGFL
jgi:hypothetical protein